MYYIGSHWGFEDDGYICSSPWMKRAYKSRPSDFKRRIIKGGFTSREDMINEELRFINMIKPSEIKKKNPRYYNLNIIGNALWHHSDDEEKRMTVGQKISKANKGKSHGPCSPEKAANISAAKKKKFEEKSAKTGKKFSDEHREKLRQAKLGTKHTEEWKADNSVRLKEQ